MKGTFAAAVFLPSVMVVLAARTAAAEEETRLLGLVDATPNLERSATIALSPWNVRVRDVAGEPPSGVVGAASREAQAFVSAGGLDALAWLVETGDARTLLLYDAHTGQIVSRDVAAGPIDDVAAAAIALSLKTLLRASTVAPEQERLGGRGGGGGREDSSSGGIGLFRFEGDVAMRLRASDGTQVDPRVGLALSWWPRPFARYLGITLRVETGTGLPVENSELTGRLVDYAAAVGVRARVPIASQVAVEPAVAGALHVTRLDGAVADGDPIANLSRVDPVLETSLQLTLGLGRSFELGLRGGVLFWKKWQQYEVDGETALRLSPAQAEVGLVLGAALNP